MLLTKPITALLQQSLTHPLTTLMLVTPSGQILASASTLPSTILRSRATLAIGIWGLYSTNAKAIETALPPGASKVRVQEGKGNGKEEEGKVQTITVQLTLGILTIRVLSCGLLVLGLSDPPPPPPTAAEAAVPSTTEQALLDNSSPPQPSSNAGSMRIKNGAPPAPGTAQEGRWMPSSPPAGMGVGVGVGVEGTEGRRSYAPSECGSTSTVSGKGREVQALRRRTLEVAGVLDGELRGSRVSETI